MVRRVLLAAVGAALLLALASGFLFSRLFDPEAVRTAVERQAASVLSQPVRIRAVDWTLSARPRVVLTGVEIGQPAAIVLERVELATGLRALFSRRVEQAGVVVAGSRVRLPLPFTLGSSGAAAASTAADAAPAVLAIVSVDEIALRGIELLVGEQRLVLELASSLSGRRLTVSQVRLTSDRSSIHGSGELPDIGELRGRFDLAAETLDLDELLTVASGISDSGTGGDASARGAGRGAVRGPDVNLQVDLRATGGRALGQEFSDLATRLLLTQDGLVLDPIGMRLLDGRLDGRLRVDTSRSPTQVTLAADVRDMDVARLATLADAEGAITGRLAGRVELQASADAAGVTLASSRGTASLAITDGRIPGLDLVRPVITAFGTTGSVARGDSGFSRLAGTFSLAEGVLSSSDLSLVSTDVDLRGEGTVTVSDLAVDLRADLVLSEALTAQAGRDLRRYAREGSRIVLPATVRGPLAKPVVLVDVGQAMKRAARNIVENEVKKGLKRLFKW